MSQSGAKYCPHGEKLRDSCGQCFLHERLAILLPTLSDEVLAETVETLWSRFGSCRGIVARLVSHLAEIVEDHQPE